MELEKILSNPWDNVYWFSRMLINSDKYGGIGADSGTMKNVATSIRAILDSKKIEKENELSKFKILSETIRNVFLHKRKKGAAKYRAIEALCDDLIDKMDSTKDLEVLALTCEKVMVPINKALKEIPSDDNVFVESIAKALLDNKGVKGLANIINILDDVGI